MLSIERVNVKYISVFVLKFKNNFDFNFITYAMALLNVYTPDIVFKFVIYCQYPSASYNKPTAPSSPT